MSELLGLTLAIIAAFVWGTQYFPLKKIKNPNMPKYQVFMSFGIFLISIILTFALSFPFVVNYFGVVAGIFWVIGNLFHILAVKHIGLGKGSALPLGTALVISFLTGSFFFNESFVFLLGLAGVITFLIAIPFVTYSKEKVKTNKSGIAYGFIAGIFFSTILIFFKLGNLPPGEFLFPLSLGILLMGIIIFFVKVRSFSKDYFYNGIASGVLWGIGMLSATFTVTYIGLAIGQPLTQMAILIAVFWGLFYFKEIQDKKTIMMVLVGTIVLIITAILLSLATTL